MSISESIADYFEEKDRQNDELLLLINLKKEMEQEMGQYIDTEVERIKGINDSIEECISEFSNVRSLLEEYCEGKTGEAAREVVFRRIRHTVQTYEIVNDAIKSCKVSKNWFW